MANFKMCFLLLLMGATFSSNSQSARTLEYNKIVKKFEEKNYQGCMIDLDKLLSIDPTYDSAISLRGVIKLIDNNYLGCISDMTKLSRLATTDILSCSALFRRGVAKISLQDYLSARQDFLDFLDENKLFKQDLTEYKIVAIAGLCVCEKELNRKKEACNYFKMLKSMDFDISKMSSDVIEYCSAQNDPELGEEYQEKEYDESLDAPRRNYLIRDSKDLKYAKIGNLYVMTSDLVSNEQGENGNTTDMRITLVFDEPNAIANAYGNGWRIPTEKELEQLMMAPSLANFHKEENTYYYLSVHDDKMYSLMSILYFKGKFIHGKPITSDGPDYFKVRLVKSAQ